MGCGMSTEEREGKARNDEIENELKRDRSNQRNEIKMLLLGMFRLQTGTALAMDTNRTQVPENPENLPS